MGCDLLEGKNGQKYFLDYVEDEYCTVEMPNGKIVLDATDSIICKPLVSESFYPDRMEVNQS